MHTTTVFIREERKYPVYGRQQSSKTAPLGWVSEEQALWMLESGGANWFNNRGRSLRLTDDASPARDSACQMGPRVIIALALGQKWAIEVWKEWKANHHGKLSAQSGKNGRIPQPTGALARSVQPLPQGA